MGSEAVDALNWLAGFRNGPTYSDPDPMQFERIWELASRRHPGPDAFSERAAAQRFLKECPERVLSDGSPTPTAMPHFDQSLKRSAKTYRHVVADLRRRGPLQRARRPRCQVGPFFLEKDSGKRLRLILAARLANELFEAQQFLQGCNLHLGLADVKDCFHRLRFPSWLTEYFCLPEAPAFALVVEGQLWEGRPVELHGLANGLHLEPVGRPPVSGPADPVGHVANSVYVGNLGVALASEPLVSDAVQQLVRGFDEQGSFLRGRSVSMEAETLGTEVSGPRWKTRVTQERFWWIRQAINGLRRRRRLTGWAVEVLVGHCTCSGLPARGALSVIHAAHAFTRKFYATTATPWLDTRAELEVFRGLLIFLESDWALLWKELAVATDSSLKAGRMQERARFREVVAGPLAAEDGGLPAARRGARGAALVAAGFWRDGGGQWRLADAGDDAQLAAVGGADPGSPEVPAAGLASSRCRTKQVLRWRFEEGILIKRARSPAMGIRRIAQSVFGAACRQLILSDNMSVVLSLNGSRAKEFALLVQIRRFHAYRLARNVNVSVRWVPSELNPADYGLRVFDKQVAKWPLGSQLLDTLPSTAPAGATVAGAGRSEAPAVAAACSDERRADPSAAPPEDAVGVPAVAELDGSPELGCAAADDWQRQIAAHSDGDSSTSDEQQVVQAGERREKELLRRAAKRKRTYGAEALQDSAAADGRTIMERRSVFAPARRRCGLELGASLELCDAEPRRPSRSPAQVGEALVDYVNALLFSGHESSKGDHVMAAPMHRFPEYSKQGESKTPRDWRCLRGWRKLAPARSRRACEPLRGKTGLADVGVMLGSGWFQCAAPVFREIAQGAPEEKLSDFSCLQFLKMFRMALQGLGVEQHVVPFQARHSGLRPVRSTSLPWGIPDATEHAKNRIAAGSATCRAALTSMRCFVRAGAP
ncbi:unnamed protein product [Prorocentrum cordatum]|uniref:Reverse transcriptase domain-containing protein n=1 Tax=Prorocentrum cordatum TaxID=2364126 RepID=A0ABN9W3L9_9DINO|nr:unnamed protein product [Polarella glacialis]